MRAAASMRWLVVVGGGTMIGEKRMGKMGLALALAGERQTERGCLLRLGMICSPNQAG